MSDKRRKVIGAKNADQQVRLIRRLREIRLSNGISVHEVAEAMDVDQTMIYRFERGGTNFTASTLRKYAKGIGALLDLDAFPAASDPECQSREIPDTPHDRQAAQRPHISVKRERRERRERMKPTPSSSAVDFPRWTMLDSLSTKRKELQSK